MGDAPKVTVMKAHGYGRWPGKRVLLIMLVALIVIGAGAWVLATRNSKTLVTHSSNAAIDTLVTQASNYLGQSDASKLQPIVAKLKQQSGCDQSADCLYILTKYYINVDDATNAQTYCNKLMAVYSPKKGYSNIHIRNLETPAQLKSQVAFVQQSNKEASSNFYGISAGQSK